MTKYQVASTKYQVGLCQGCGGYDPSLTSPMCSTCAAEHERIVDLLIDVGLCFYTCSPDCEGRCMEFAEQAAARLVTGRDDWPQDSAEVLAEYGVGPLAEETS